MYTAGLDGANDIITLTVEEATFAAYNLRSLPVAKDANGESDTDINIEITNPMDKDTDDTSHSQISDIVKAMQAFINKLFSGFSQWLSRM